MDAQSDHNFDLELVPQLEFLMKNSTDQAEIIRKLDVIEQKLVNLINDIFSRHYDQHIPQAIAYMRVLGRACRLGKEFQWHLCRNQLPWLIHILANQESVQRMKLQKIEEIAWKCLVNLITQNIENQKSIWSVHRELLLERISIRHEYVNLACMSVYYIYRSELIDSDGSIILANLINVLRCEMADPKYTTTSEYLQYHLEYFICEQKQIVPLYSSLSDENRLTLLYFMVDFLRPPRDESLKLSTQIVLHVAKEFKKKSDCVLKTVASYVNNVCPKEVCALLEILAVASGVHEYAAIVSTDRSLFLNAGCLLQTINALGLKSDNVFTPISKLGQMAPNSREGADIERDISYELKSMLVRLIGNLAYRNPANQELAKEMDIILAVLNCTNMDARNPLIREWSILAIRNLCEGNAANQAIVASLTKVGEADNSDILKEFNIEFGSMRIGGGETVDANADSKMDY